MNRKILVVACVLTLASVTVGFSQQPAHSEVLTLQQAIDVALRNNRSAKNAQLEVEKANDKVAALRTRRLPSFNLNSLISKPLTSFETTFDRGVFGTYPGIGPVPAENTAIESSTRTTAMMMAQVAQPLTQLRRLGFQIKQQEIGRQISEAQLDATEQEIVNQVKRTYYSILQTQEASAAAEEAVKLYQELDRVTGEYVIQEVALKTDHMDVQTRAAKAEYEVLTLSNVLASQKEQLNHLLGRDLGTEFSVTNGFEAIQISMRETDLVQARKRALEQRPEIREAKLRIEQAILDKRAKKTERIPDVSLTYNYLSTFNYSNFVPRSVSSVGVQVEWEIFDWGRKNRELDEKNRTIAQAENSLRDTENQVLMEVNSRFRSLQEASQQIRIAKLSQTAARATVQLVSYHYRVEAVLLKDVLQAQTTLAESNSEYQKALMAFWTAKADLEKALGEDK